MTDLPDPDDLLTTAVEEILHRQEEWLDAAPGQDAMAAASLLIAACGNPLRTAMEYKLSNSEERAAMYAEYPMLFAEIGRPSPLRRG